jgi:hypothetical protein
VDRGLVARIRPEHAVLMPHGGLEVVRSLCVALTRGGVAPGGEASAEELFPEARSPFEAELLATLSRAASPLAIDLLLDQPRRWAAWGMPDPDFSTPAPDPEHSGVLNRLLDPPLVVAVGAPNIGKSTLLNRLAGRAVVAVADEPGTTRDHVGALVDVGGLVVSYVDTPGMREGAPAAEREAASAVPGLLASAALTVLLGDAESPPPPRAGPGLVLRVALRADLGVAAWPHEVAVSAASGAGIPELALLLRETLLPDEAVGSALPWRFWGASGPTLTPGM